MNVFWHRATHPFAAGGPLLLNTNTAKKGRRKLDGPERCNRFAGRFAGLCRTYFNTVSFTKREDLPHLLCQLRQ